jgi:cupin fold WbuC family metalloprotein
MNYTSLPINKVNDEVYIAKDEIVQFDASAIEFMKECAIRNPRGRARICAHKKSTDTLHEMLIAIRADSYIRPHRHHDKVESFHLIEGTADIVIFDEQGDITDIVSLGEKTTFYYRLDIPRYHTLLINSPVLVIHEITNGPFNISDSDWADFSPEEGAPDAKAYITKLRSTVVEKKGSLGKL